MVATGHCSVDKIEKYESSSKNKSLYPKMHWLESESKCGDSQEVCLGGCATYQ